jgi:hypothetical protein
MPLDDHRFINGVADGRVKQQATGAIRKRIAAPDLGSQVGVDLVHVCVRVSRVLGREEANSFRSVEADDVLRPAVGRLEHAGISAGARGRVAKEVAARCDKPLSQCMKGR